MKINKNNNTEIWILNVKRGLSILIKTPHNYGILYDLGSTEDFSPIDYYFHNYLFNDFEEYSDSHYTPKKLAQCIISHPHLDHISDLNSDNTDYLRNNSFYITCQNDKTESSGEKDNKTGHKIDFDMINNPDNASDEINNYKKLYEGRNLPLSTLIYQKNTQSANFKIGYYYLTHKQAIELFPEDQQKYSNSLSIVLYLAHGNNSILIPGDITPESIKLIIDGKCERRFTDYSLAQGEHKKIEWAKNTSDQPILKKLLKEGLTILVAPHHGLESGYPEYLFQIMDNKKPELIIISDKRHDSDISGKTHPNYQNGVASSSHLHKGKPRFSLSTVNDGHIKIIFTGIACTTNSSTEIDYIFN